MDKSIYLGGIGILRMMGKSTLSIYLLAIILVSIMTICLSWRFANPPYSPRLGVLTTKGEYELSQGSYRRAYKFYRRALSLNENNLKVKQMIEKINELSEIQSEASLDNQTLLQSQDDVDFNIVKANLLRLSDDHESALALLTKIIEGDSQMPVAWYYLGKTYNELTDYNKSALALEKALNLAPNNIIYLRYSSVVAWRAKNYEMALSIYQSLSEEDPINLLLKLLTTRTLVYLGRYERIEDNINAIIDLLDRSTIRELEIQQNELAFPDDESIELKTKSQFKSYAQWLLHLASMHKLNTLDQIESNFTDDNMVKRLQPNDYQHILEQTDETQ